MSKNSGCLFALLSFLFPNNEEKEQEISEYEQKEKYNEPVQQYEYHYRSKYFLTKNEYYFYKSLKPIADKLGYSVLSKVRMADLVEPTCSQYSKQYKYSFSKIKSKHVDFVLANPENLKPILLIELDDASHDNNERDDFINKAYKEAGYKILHIRGSMELEQKIIDSIKQQ